MFFFDISVFVFMFVLADLSNRLGEAQRKPPYYKFLYGSALLVIVASVFDVFSEILSFHYGIKISLFIRFCAGVAACFVAFKYWIWVFSEFFKH